MHPSRSTARLIVVSIAALGAGAILGVTALSGAATTTTPLTTKPPAASSPAAPGTGGGFRSNENATHESGESSAREAAENSGQLKHGPFGSNENPTHEGSESPAREGQESSTNPRAQAPTSPAAPASVGNV